VRRGGLKVTNRANPGVGAFSFRGRAFCFCAAVRFRYWLAMERNEVQGICLAYDSLARGTLFRANELNILLEAALDPDPRLKDVPSGIDFARSDEERRALELFFARAMVGRPFVAPPQIPADRLRALSQGFEETLRDPTFLADAEVQKLRVETTTGEQLTAIIAKAYQAPTSIVKRTMQAMGRAK
jgi:hypothetical protein